MTSRGSASLLSFFIFNSKYGPKEGEVRVMFASMTSFVEFDLHPLTEVNRFLLFCAKLPFNVVVSVCRIMGLLYWLESCL